MKKLALIISALVCMSGLASTARAIAINIEVGDRPYYLYGERYWSQGAYWCWVRGHWSHHHPHVWIHGHYRRC